jgi:hypothetical protein
MWLVRLHPNQARHVRNIALADRKHNCVSNAREAVPERRAISQLKVKFPFEGP